MHHRAQPTPIDRMLGIAEGKCSQYRLLHIKAGSENARWARSHGGHNLDETLHAFYGNGDPSRRRRSGRSGRPLSRTHKIDKLEGTPFRRVRMRR
jgi:hypothetical protein